MSEINQEKDLADIQNQSQKENQKNQNTEVKEGENRFKIHNRIHNNFAIRYFNMVANYISGHKK